MTGEPHQVSTVTPTGQDVAVWAPVLHAARHVPFADLAQVLHPPADADPATLIVAGAHPDDETLGLGRLASAWAHGIGPVIGVSATAGEACVDHVTSRPPGIAERRIAEWHTAVNRLGFAGRHLLELPDGRVAEQEDALTTELTAIADRAAATGPVVLAAPWRGDPHPDHRAVGRAAARIAETSSRTLVEYAVWMTYWTPPASVRLPGQELLVVQHDQRAELAHREATAAFTSQLTPLAPHLTPVLPSAMLEHQRLQLLIVARDLADRIVRR